ncbi:hypothetical protein [Sorangium sp. So ce406]|uniref:hypothetical protein n=1 Tax=Sorangium sp. So ce406 TaxID=3133311 RepID=UPI003F5CA723
MRALSRPLLALLSVLSAAGCAASQRPAPRAEPPPPPPLTMTDVRALFGEVSAARGLPERALVPVALLDAPSFAAALQRRITGAPSQEEIERRAGFLLAFNLVQQVGPGARRPSSMREVLEEQVSAFYDGDIGHIVVRAAPARTAQDAREQRAVLAHEFQHALQAQNFGLPDLGALPGEERRLAQLAVIEGDATLTMMAYLSADAGAPLGRTLRRAAELSRQLSLDALPHREGNAALRAALPIARERLLFPYAAGAAFVADIYRAGGFPLVNHLYARPPASTEQVLHPQKYLDGEPIVPVRAPEAPPGYRTLGSEPLGELQTRVVLERCAPAAEARIASEGWGGDAFSVIGDGAQGVALLWSTAWDTERDAEEFEAALRKDPGCWRGLRLGEGPSARAVDGAFVVLREGARVAFVRGLPEPLATATARSLLTLPGAPPPPSPVGAFQVPPRSPPPAPWRGFVQGAQYRSDWLGVWALLPAGVPATTTDEDLELRLGRTDILVRSGLVVSDRVATPRLVEKLFRDVATGFAKAAGERPLVAVSGGSVAHPLGPAIERTWEVAGTRVALRAVVVPVCGGTGSYVFLQTWADPYARSVLDGWLHSFRWLSPGRPPVCEALDPR